MMERGKDDSVLLMSQTSVESVTSGGFPSV